MRMLTKEERDMLLLRDNAKGWDAHDTIQRLKSCGRVAVTQVDEVTFDFENTEWGEKALRVDEIIRQGAR